MDIIFNFCITRDRAAMLVESGYLPTGSSEILGLLIALSICIPEVCKYLLSLSFSALEHLVRLFNGEWTLRLVKDILLLLLLWRS